MIKTPKAVGPYSIYREAGNLVFISGQLGLDPETNSFVGNTASSQATQALKNIQNILASLNLTMKDVVKTLILLDNIEDYKAVNEVYASFFEEPYPARSAFEVAKLPLQGLVEIEVIAVKNN